VVSKTKLRNQTPVDNKLKVIYTLTDLSLGYRPGEPYL